MVESALALDDLERSPSIIGTAAFDIGMNVIGLNGDSIIDLTEEDVQRWTDWYGQWLKTDDQEKTAYQVLLALKGD